MNKVHKIKSDKKSNQFYIVAGDWHSFHLDESAYKALIATAKSISKKNGKSKVHLVINGDFLDVPYLMKKDEGFQFWKTKSVGIESFFIPMLDEECDWGNIILDELQKIFKTITLVGGNHCEARIRYFRESKHCPKAYKHYFDLEARLKLKERNIKLIKYNDFLQLGKNLFITHGMFHGSTCHKKHYEAVSSSIIFSHIHNHGVKAFSCLGETKHSISLPAMCKLDPEYLKGNTTNWSVGFGLVVLRPDNMFHFTCHQLWNDKLILPGGEEFEF